VGAGWLREEIELLGQDPAQRGKRMDEMIDVMRRFWDGNGTAEYHGEFFDFGPTGMHPVPTQRIPIWVGGRSKAALARAARNDGWLGMNYGLDEIPGLLSQLADERKRHLDAGGDPDLSFETLVIANAMPSRSLYDDLTEKGVTSTVCVAWPPGDERFRELEPKIEAMAAFADAHIDQKAIS
jgi:alkanesulfonate monooxygenase SsuD/methylene tetrahydromethanopterin reductase-like flavin-dependent oxidoreductase (luciferase family)